MICFLPYRCERSKTSCPHSPAILSPYLEPFTSNQLPAHLATTIFPPTQILCRSSLASSSLLTTQTSLPQIGTSAPFLSAHPILSSYQSSWLFPLSMSHSVKGESCCSSSVGAAEQVWERGSSELDLLVSGHVSLLDCRSLCMCLHARLLWMSGTALLIWGGLGTPVLQDLLAHDVLMSLAKVGQQQRSHGCILPANSCGCVCCADQPYGQWSV